MVRTRDLYVSRISVLYIGSLFGFQQRRQVLNIQGWLVFDAPSSATEFIENVRGLVVGAVESYLAVNNHNVTLLLLPSQRTTGLKRLLQLVD